MGRFGHDSKPSRIWGYKASAPHEGRDEVDEQLRLARPYRNALIEQELRRREQADAVMLARHPEVKALREAWEKAEADVDALVEDVKKRNQESRRRTATKEDRKAIKDAKEARKKASDAHKAAKKAAYADPDLKADLKAIDEQDNAERKRIRAESPLYWGTKGIVDQALSDIRSSSPPEFKRWNGEGAVAVQCQGGLAWTDALLGASSLVRVQLESLAARPTVNKRGQPIPVADPNSRRSQRTTRAIVWVRVGSKGAAGREPIWAKVRIHLHRHPPADSRIKWVYLRRTYVGFREQWAIQFVLEREEWTREGQAEHGIAGLDLGWRKVADGLRVAYLADEPGHTESIELTHEHLGMWEHAESLQSIRDRNFDEIRAKLCVWLKATRSLPDWTRKEFKNLVQWKSASHLASVVHYWRANRFDGDEAIFSEAEAWRKQDRHIHDWARAERCKAESKRNTLYRTVAARLAHTYHTVNVEAMNIQDLLVTHGTEAEIPDSGVRRYAKIAAVGKLRQFIGEAVAKMQKVCAVNTTRRCHECGTMNKFDAKANLFFTCSGCGKLWDQDHNAALNIRDGEPVPEKPRKGVDPVEPDAMADPTGTDFESAA